MTYANALFIIFGLPFCIVGCAILQFLFCTSISIFFSFQERIDWIRRLRGSYQSKRKYSGACDDSDFEDFTHV